MKKIITFLLSIPLLFQLQTASAESNNNSKVSLPFNVSFDMPLNQDKETKDYFNLTMEPDQIQTVYFIIQNTGQKVLNLDLKASNAIMSLSGGIVYDEDRGSKYTYLTDKSYYMDQYLNLPKGITLNPNEVKKVPITIKAPNRAMGTILGGVLFIPKDNEKGTSSDSKVSFSLNTRLRLNAPIQINLPNTEKGSPLKINNSETLIFPSGANVTFDMENPNNSILKGISYQYYVKSEDGKELFNGTIPPFSVAPKSKVTIPISWDYDTYKSGKYRLILYPSYNKKEIVNDFDISVKDVKTYVKETHQKPATPIVSIPIYVWILLPVVMISFIYLAYRLGKKNSSIKKSETVEI